MKIINGLKELKKPIDGSVVTIGVFDGVHVGHRKVISEAVRSARRLDLKSVVLTFAPHPLKVLHPKSWIPSLVSLPHRLRLIEELGVDETVIIKFSKPFASLSAECFVKDVLVSRLDAREVFVSEGFYFGKSAAQGAAELKRLGNICGFKVKIVKPLKFGSKIVSSSMIRNLIVQGDIGRAAKLLGRSVSVLGTVVKGASLARELGYPTANINPHHEVVPPGGVYAVRVAYKGRLFKGVLNIGLKPTFFGPRDREPSIEVHIFDFHNRIYGEDLEIFFVKRLRVEVKFKKKGDLVRQIRRDVAHAYEILADK